MENTDAIDPAAVIAIRETTKLDQRQFAQLLGVSERTIRGWENGATIPASAQFTLRLVRHCVSVPVVRLKSGKAYSGALGLLVPWIDQLDAVLGRVNA